TRRWSTVWSIASGPSRTRARVCSRRVAWRRSSRRTPPPSRPSTSSSRSTGCASSTHATEDAMSPEEVAKLRNVAIVGQGGTGKTSVADALLFAAGSATRIGRVDDGSSAFDTEAEEQRRKSTITAALHHVTWKRHEVNLIDTPAYSAFLHDTRNCLTAATGVVLVLGPTGGEIKVETEKVWGRCRERGLPAVGFGTRLERERASVDHALAHLKLLGAEPAVVQGAAG